MMSLGECVVLGVCVIVGLNFYATMRVLRSCSFERSQKIAQIAMVWIFPIFGSTIMIYFSNEANHKLSSNSLYNSVHDCIGCVGGYDNGGAD